MKNTGFLMPSAICIFAFVAVACSEKEPKKDFPQLGIAFDASNLSVKDDGTIKKVRGQVLYLPVYSNIPFFEHGRKYDLSAFVTIHNTDFNYKMRITKVLLFDNEGKLVSNYLNNDSIIQPLGATSFLVSERDKSGTGANFIIEWISDSLINEPLVESVMHGLSSGQGISFSSTGRIVRESK
jgi:hypothetical protein